MLGTGLETRIANLVNFDRRRDGFEQKPATSGYICHGGFSFGGRIWHLLDVLLQQKNNGRVVLFLNVRKVWVGARVILLRSNEEITTIISTHLGSTVSTHSSP